MTIHEFSAEERQSLFPAEKIALLGTVSPEGLPHLSLLTSLQVHPSADDDGPQRLTMGEFSYGLSKQYLAAGSRAGFLFMTLDRQVWKGTAEWTGSRDSGSEYEDYNNLPMFRYNSYFGIHRVHYFNIVSASPAAALPLARILTGTVQTAAAAFSPGRTVQGAPVLGPFSRKLFDPPGTLKFFCWLDSRGYPRIEPVLPCRTGGTDRLVFRPAERENPVWDLPADTPVAVMAASLDLESVLVRGRFMGFHRRKGIRLGTVLLDWAYNSMPPNHGRIYPPEPLEAVRIFT